MKTNIPSIETKYLFDPVLRFEPLSRDEWERIRRAFTAIQAITAGLNFVDHRYGAGVIDEHTKCVWTRARLRVTFFSRGGPYGASLSKEPDPACPKLEK